MKRILIAALAITLVLSAAIISLKPTGAAVSGENYPDYKNYVDVGSAEIEEGKLEFMDIDFDFAGKSI
ncbi:MAG: hypothetical protein HYT73_01975 [Candidatus Aenigmarchaeota archaeon]|nr:hypothetical protein [Candidatus Aenigmarchaeota archaeon]